MATTIRICFLFGICCIRGICVWAQTEDFGVWYGCNVEKNVFERVDLEFATSLRTENNGKSINQFYFEGGLQYQPLKYMSVSGFYRLISKSIENGNYYASNRFYGDIKVWHTFRRLKVSIRERLQYQKNTYAETSEDLLPVYYSRCKLEGVYDLPGLPLKVIAYAEWFSPFVRTMKRPRYVDQKRLSIGLSYKIKKKQNIELAYIHKREFNKSIVDLNILSIGYNFKF